MEAVQGKIEIAAKHKKRQLQIALSVRFPALAGAPLHRHLPFHFPGGANYVVPHICTPAN